MAKRNLTEEEAQRVYVITEARHYNGRDPHVFLAAELMQMANLPEDGKGDFTYIESPKNAPKQIAVQVPPAKAPNVAAGSRVVAMSRDTTTWMVVEFDDHGVAWVEE